jgi:uncharacterized membrane protein YqjE
VTAGSHEVGPGGSAPAPQETRGLGEIIGEVTSDLSDLFKQEVELAKVELKQEATKAGKGAGMLAGAGISALLLLVFLSLTLMFLLDEQIPIWVAAAIVTLLWAVITAVLALVGRKNLKKANPQLPKTQQTLKEDARWASEQRN